jgi:hypothetical protein
LVLILIIEINKRASYNSGFVQAGFRCLMGRFRFKVFAPIQIFSFKLFGIFVNISNKNPRLHKAGGTLAVTLEKRNLKMEMKYIKFKLPENISETQKDGILKKSFFNLLEYVLSKIIPKANPDFEKFIDDVEYWILECETESGIPTREIGIDKNEKVILKMPFKNDYGYWIDNNFLLNDFVNKFNAVEIEKKDFEANWEKIN